MFVKTYDELIKTIRDHEINTIQKYIISHSTKTFREENVTVTPNMRIHWANNIPYFHLGARTYSCQHGKDLNLLKKQKYNEQRDKKAMEEHIFIKRYRKFQMTKKLDCPAMIHVKRILQFPNYKISDSGTRRGKLKASTMIKEQISDYEHLIGEEGYMFNLPSASDHKNHPAGNVQESVDEKVKDFICKLVADGKTNISDICELIETYVENELLISDKSRKRFYPDSKTVRRIVTQAKNNLKQSKIDQENIINLIKTLATSECQLFFKPCSEQESKLQSLDDTHDDWEHESQFIFIYQSKNMKDLYKRYGNNAILLDGAHKTLKYTFPLYFIVVQTNAKFQIVCVIITQSENTESLTEALTIFKDWNPNISPKYAMTDFDMEEISSLENVFYGIEVFICPFYREKAWFRWITQKKKSEIPRNELLTKLRKIANSTIPTKLTESINALKSWEHYTCSPLQKYFENIWEPEMKRWVLAYKPLDLFLNTNKGTEKINEELNYRYLENYKNGALSEFMKIILTNFLPDRYNIYLKENLLMSQHFQEKSEDSSEILPKFLYNRPKWLVTHVQRQLNEISYSEIDTIKEIEPGKFSLISGNNPCLVKFDNKHKYCSCSCTDFCIQRLVCQHVLMIGIKYPFWNLENRTWVLDNPVFKIDESILDTCDIMVDPFCETNDNILRDEDLASSNEFRDLMDIDGSCGTDPLIYEKLKDSEPNKKSLIENCNSTIQSIQSLMWCVNEESLSQVYDTLKTALAICSSHISFSEIEVQEIDEPINQMYL